MITLDQVILMLAVGVMLIVLFYHFMWWVMDLTKPTRWVINVRFEPRDMWVGVYWTTTPQTFDLYVCFIPMVPVRFRWTTE